MKKITQNLRWLVTLLAMIVSTGAWAQEVEYNFLDGNWTVNNGTLSNGTVSFTGQGGTNFKMNSGYFFLGFAKECVGTASRQASEAFLPQQHIYNPAHESGANAPNSEINVAQRP